MDWSMDPPQATASPTPCVTSASEHVPLPHVPSHNKGSNGKNRANSTAPSVLSYGEGQPAISGNWDGSHHALSIFGSEDTLTKDSGYTCCRKALEVNRHYICCKVEYSSFQQRQESDH